MSLLKQVSPDKSNYWRGQHLENLAKAGVTNIEELSALLWRKSVNKTIQDAGGEGLPEWVLLSMKDVLGISDPKLKTRSRSTKAPAAERSSTEPSVPLERRLLGGPSAAPRSTGPSAPALDPFAALAELAAAPAPRVPRQQPAEEGIGSRLLSFEESKQDELSRMTQSVLWDLLVAEGLPGLSHWARDEILQQLRAARDRRKASEAELRQLCAERGFSAERHASEEMLEILANHEWEEQGVPVTRLPSKEEARELMSQLVSIEHLDAVELRRRWLEEGLPDVDLPFEARQLHLKKVLVWSSLPLEELQQECEAHGLSATCYSTDAAAAEELVARLTELVSSRERRLRAVGINPDLVDGVEDAEALLCQLDRQQTKDIRSLHAMLLYEYQALGYQPASSVRRLSRRGTLERLRKILLWQRMSVPSLRAECLRLEVAVDKSMKRKGMTVALLRHTDATAEQDAEMELWEEEGFETKRIGEYSVVKEIVREYKDFASLDEEEMREYFDNGLGAFIPEDDIRSFDCDNMCSLMKKVLIWKNFPLEELRRECLQLRPDWEAAVGDLMEEALYQALSLSLFTALWQRQGIPLQRLDPERGVVAISLWQQAHLMSFDDLCQWYEGMGFPAEQDMERSQLARLSAKTSVWGELPLSELVLLCKDRRLPSRVEGSEEEQHGLLLESLVFDELKRMWDKRGFEAMRMGSLDDVIDSVQQYESWRSLDDGELMNIYKAAGFPAVPGVERESTLKCLKQFLVWRMLPLSELHKECKDRGPALAAEVGPLIDETQRDEVIGLLIVNDHRELFEGVGIRVAELGFLNAATASSHFARYETLPEEDLAEECGKMGIRPRSSATREEMLADAKKAVLWMCMPPKMLWEECKGLGVQTEAREGLVNILMLRRALEVIGHSQQQLNGQHTEGKQRNQEGNQTGPEAAAAGEASASAAAPEEEPPEVLQQGTCFCVSLYSSEEQQRPLRPLARPHPWLRREYTRLDVDALPSRAQLRELAAEKLIKYEVMKKVEASVEALAERPPGVARMHLGLYCCGCAMAHRHAWQQLVNSEKEWALILEDSIVKFCDGFDRALADVLSGLPEGWTLCYLGSDCVECPRMDSLLLPPGARAQGVLRAVPSQGVFGLWGYLITKGFAKALLGQIFPLAGPIDMVVRDCAVSAQLSFYLPSGHFLLLSNQQEAVRSAAQEAVPADEHEE